MRGVLAGLCEQIFAMNFGLDIALSKNRVDRRFDVFGLSLFEQEHVAFANAKIDDFLGYHWVGNIHHVDWNVRVAEIVRESLPLQRSDNGIIGSPAGNNTQVLMFAREKLIEFIFDDKVDGRRPALADLVFFLLIDMWWKDDFFRLAVWHHMIF